jgi:hypothetical protein
MIILRAVEESIQALNLLIETSLSGPSARAPSRDEAQVRTLCNTPPQSLHPLWLPPLGSLLQHKCDAIFALV